MTPEEIKVALVRAKQVVVRLEKAGIPSNNDTIKAYIQGCQDTLDDTIAEILLNCPVKKGCPPRQSQ